MRIILASKSKARKKILSDLGLKFEIMPSNVDEEQIYDPIPSQRVKKLALLKAQAVYNKLKQEKNILIIACDTLVCLPKTNRQLAVYRPKTKFIGKPKNKEDAKKILMMLSDSRHYLYSGLCVICSCNCDPAKPEKQSQSLCEIASSPADWRVPRNDIKIFLDYEKTMVTFRKLSEEEIDEYVKDPEVLNHAGAYTIEKSTMGEGFIRIIKGSYSNVLGLPTEKLTEVLKSLDIELKLLKNTVPSPTILSLPHCTKTGILLFRIQKFPRWKK